MIDVFPFAGYPIALLGLDASGLQTARALAASGAQLLAWDDDNALREEAAAFDIPIHDWTKADLRKFTSVVISENIVRRARGAMEIARLARGAGCEVIADSELLARAQRECGYIGVAGSPATALVCALIAHVLCVSGRDAQTIEAAPHCALDTQALGLEGAYVLEMTPFRLEHTVSITFDIAVFLGVDEHDGEAGEIERLTPELFRRQTYPRAAVIVVDKPYGRALHKDLAGRGEQRLFPVSGKKALERGVFVEDGMLFDATEGGARMPIVDLSALSGSEHHAGIAAAYGAALAAGVKPHQAMAAIVSFAQFKALPD